MRAAGLLGALFIIGVILLIVGIEGRFGALLAVILTPRDLLITGGA